MNDYAHMRANEELAALFSRNLTFQSPPQQPVQQMQPVAETKPGPTEEQPIIYSITQHYTHSAHITREPEPEPIVEPQRPSSEPPQTQQPSAELILHNYGIDYRSLSASQTELFKTAEDAQKLRLIELWRICPPCNQQESSAVALSSTTVEQEEMLAQMRYEHKLTEDSVMSLDGTPLTPVQTEDGAWISMSSASEMEPYMTSGYEALARREYEESAKRAYDESILGPKEVYHHYGTSASCQQAYRPATDPVYNNSNGWASRQEAMENQYGAFQMGNEMEL
ncbi:hypothetical protein PG999_006051 [Apiospora kogelbergensis]|uniref:Uncharacterized protein n=1 Tax=Apiospora kogelbergensis TaxID=1337665 RepID=A0AAW0QR34_9PEZI